LSLYPFSQVTKFVFEGKEEFTELAQAFFHFTAWHSGGKEVVADVQGFEDEDGDIVIVDPFVIRPKPINIGELVGTILPGGEQQQETPSPEQLRFDAWHPKCGQLCKAFDPSRRSANCRRHCGLGVPNCGLGGG